MEDDEEPKVTPTKDNKQTVKKPVASSVAAKKEKEAAGSIAAKKSAAEAKATVSPAVKTPPRQKQSQATPGSGDNDGDAKEQHPRMKPPAKQPFPQTPLVAKPAAKPVPQNPAVQSPTKDDPIATPLAAAAGKTSVPLGQRTPSTPGGEGE